MMQYANTKFTWTRLSDSLCDSVNRGLAIHPSLIDGRTRQGLQSFTDNGNSLYSKKTKRQNSDTYISIRGSLAGILISHLSIIIASKHLLISMRGHTLWGLYKNCLICISGCWFAIFNKIIFSLSINRVTINHFKFWRLLYWTQLVFFFAFLFVCFC